MTQRNEFAADLPRNAANHVPLSPVSFLERTADTWPAKAAVIHGARSFTYGELRERCRRLASALRGRGIGPGDTVAVLAPNVPVGTHRARAFLFKNGTFVSESSAQLEIRKSGFEQSIYDYAHQDSFTYGIFAVCLAMLTGWLGQLVFRKE